MSWALTRAPTLGAGGALEFGDHRLLEDGSNRSGSLGSDVVAFETASEGQDGNSERVGVSMGADTNANTLGAAAHLRSVIFVSLRMAASAVAPLSLMSLAPRLRARGIGTVRECACQWALTGKQTLGCGGGALQRGQAPALGETRSEGHDSGEVDHLHFSIVVRFVADRHLTTLVSHLGSDLEGRALYLACLDATRLAGQVVACETVWEREHESEFQSRLHTCMCT